MNSERKAFEEWASSETGWDLYWSDHINQYMDHHTNGAWLAWQASTQRQGYKLVPVEPSDDTAEYIAEKFRVCGGGAYDIYLKIIGVE